MAVRLGVSLGWYAVVEREPSLMSARLAARAAEILGLKVQELRS